MTYTQLILPLPHIDIVRTRSKIVRPRHRKRATVRVCRYCAQPLGMPAGGPTWAYIHRLHDHCAPLNQRRWRAENREKVWEINLAQAYGGMTKDEFDALAAIQGRRCGICGCDEHSARQKLPKRSKPRADGTNSSFLTPWVVDHSHRTGRVRGLLCHRCNKRIGYDEDPAMRAATHAYLSDPPADRAGVIRYGRKTRERFG